MMQTYAESWKPEAKDSSSSVDSNLCQAPKLQGGESLLIFNHFSCVSLLDGDNGLLCGPRE